MSQVSRSPPRPGTMIPASGASVGPLDLAHSDCGGGDEGAKSSSRRSSLSSGPSSPETTCKSERSPDSPFIDPGEASDEEYFKYCAPPPRKNPRTHQMMMMARGAPHQPHHHHHQSAPLAGGPAAASIGRSASAATAAAATTTATSAPKPLRSFLIDDILSYKPKIDSTSSSNKHSSSIISANSSGSSHKSSTIVNSNGNGLSSAAIVRPWDTESGQRGQSWGSSRGSGLESSHGKVREFARPRSADDESFDGSEASEDSESPASSNGKQCNANGLSSPLDALFQMTSKTLEGLNNVDKIGDASADHLNLFNNRQPPKKKRKSRTAFTNHQIFELEKRFLYQKYLSPADRDELASTLGLTGAQVITWFQNRRAKLKRDMEELKKDMEATKMGLPTKNSYSAHDYNLLKASELSSLHAMHSLNKSPV